MTWERDENEEINHCKCNDVAVIFRLMWLYLLEL